MLRLLKDCLKPMYYFFSNRNYREYSRLFSKYGKAKRFEHRNVEFLNFKIQVVDAPSFVSQFKEIYFDEIYKINLPYSNPVIYDCGANIGLSVLYFKSIFPDCSIKVFEADPVIFEFLKSNIATNSKDANIEFYNRAVWIHNDGVEFNQEGGDGGSINTSGISKRVHVPSVRLRDLIEKEKRIDFLKIDIEGAEVEVLLDCDGCFENVDRIFFEYHSFLDQPQKLDTLLKVMAKNKFRYYIESPNHLQSPFIGSRGHLTMDMQLNVYCYK